ncbi:MAG: VWA domain-containing protein [Rikenellaceae bacterium]
MFRFANIELFWLLVAIPLLLLIFMLAMYQRRKRLSRFGSKEAMAILIPNYSINSVRVKVGLFLVALTLLIVAAARPQVGAKLREVKSKGVEMMLVVDVSNSMLAEDFAPNRLSLTQYAIEQLFNGLRSQERVGLIAFAGEAKIELPITSDYRMAQAFARRLSPNTVSVQGTDIGKALELGLLSFSGSENTSKLMILITDGEAHDNRAMAAAERAKELGIRIFTVGIGTPEGAPITIDGEYMKDSEGNMVVTKLNEEMLQLIAKTTDGAYVRATNQSIGLEEIVRSINAMEQKDLKTLQFAEYGELFNYLLIAALVLLLLEFIIQERKNPYLRRFNIFSE